MGTSKLKWQRGEIQSIPNFHNVHHNWPSHWETSEKLPKLHRSFWNMFSRLHQELLYRNGHEPSFVVWFSSWLTQGEKQTNMNPYRLRSWSVKWLSLWAISGLNCLLSAPCRFSLGEESRVLHGSKLFKSKELSAGGQNALDFNGK